MQDWAYRNQVRDREWQQTLKIYDLKKKQHTLQVQENTEALYRAYEDGQIQLNNVIESTKQSNFDAWRRLTGMQGYAAASDRSGRRANMVDKMNAMTAGIERQRRLSDLTKYHHQYDRTMERYRDQAANANMRSWYNVSIAPQQTVPIPAPLLEPHTAVRPSPLGMIGGITEALGGAASAAGSLMQSPGSFGGGSPYDTNGVPGMESITGQDWFKNVSYDVPGSFGTSSSLQIPNFGQGGQGLVPNMTNSLINNIVPWS